VTSFSSVLASACPTDAANVKGKLVDPDFKKQITKIAAWPSTTTQGYTLDTCDTSAGSAFDTLLAVFQCTQVTATTVSGCTCWVADNGCASGGGSRVTGITKSSTKVHYAVVLPFSSTATTGKYKLKLWGSFTLRKCAPDNPPCCCMYWVGASYAKQVTEG
jgi:hypothetical protein